MPLTDLTADAINTYEPQRSNNALAFFNVEGAKLIGQSIILGIESFPLPKENTNVTPVPYLNEKRKYAGITEWDDLSFVFKDFCSGETADALWDWRVLVHDPATGKTGLKSSYAVFGYILLFAPDGTLDRQINLAGCWPSTFDRGEIDHNNDDYVRVNVTITIDKAWPVATPTHPIFPTAYP